MGGIKCVETEKYEKGMNRIYMVQFVAYPNLTVCSTELLTCDLSRKRDEQVRSRRKLIRTENSRTYAQIARLTRAAVFSGLNFVLSQAERTICSWESA